MLFVALKHLKSFVEKKFRKSIEEVQDESTIRKKYVKELYNIQMNEIKQMVQDKYSYIWVTIDETTDSTGRYIANFILGILDIDQNIANKK